MDRTESTTSDVNFRRVTDRYRNSEYVNKELQQKAHDMWYEIPECPDDFIDNTGKLNSSLQENENKPPSEIGYMVPRTPLNNDYGSD